MAIWHVPKLTTARKKQLLMKNSIYLAETGRKVKQAKRSSAIISNTQRAKNKAENTNFKKYKLYFNKKNWIFEKAAPIPGGNQKLSTGFVKKHKKFYKNTFQAYKVFKTYQAFNKKAMNKQYRKTNRDIRNSMDFSALMLMDSLFNSSMRKRAFQLKPGIASRMPSQNRTISSYFLNGKYVRKKNFVLYRSSKAIQKDGDFCIANIHQLQTKSGLPQHRTCEAQPSTKCCAVVGRSPPFPLPEGQGVHRTCTLGQSTLCSGWGKSPASAPSGEKEPCTMCAHYLIFYLFTLTRVCAHRPKGCSSPRRLGQGQSGAEVHTAPGPQPQRGRAEPYHQSQNPFLIDFRENPSAKQMFWLDFDFGVQPSGKAIGFGSSTRRFESFLPRINIYIVTSILHTHIII